MLITFKPSSVTGIKAKKKHFGLETEKNFLINNFSLKSQYFFGNQNCVVHRQRVFFSFSLEKYFSIFFVLQHFNGLFTLLFRLSSILIGSCVVYRIEFHSLINEIQCR